ncbi:MAG: hypothetical protein K0Q49_281 [Haloplasmataceae bacterium]|jgi:hypothetical protein|nr:hypothetical protein [Haloplasmataceae bacterium]
MKKIINIVITIALLLLLWFGTSETNYSNDIPGALSYFVLALFAMFGLLIQLYFLLKKLNN